MAVSFDAAIFFCIRAIGSDSGGRVLAGRRGLELRHDIGIVISPSRPIPLAGKATSPPKYLARFAGARISYLL